jgi:hypothetical protein
MDKFIAAETNETHKALLEMVQEHMRTEVRGQHEALMATLVDEPEYHMWGGPMEGGPKGRKAVSDFYQAMFDTNGNNFEFEVRKVIVDDNGVVTEGVLRTAMAGSAVLAGGVEEVEGESVDADGTYVNEGQLLRYGQPEKVANWWARISTSAPLGSANWCAGSSQYGEAPAEFNAVCLWRLRPAGDVREHADDALPQQFLCERYWHPVDAAGEPVADRAGIRSHYRSAGGLLKRSHQDAVGQAQTVDGCVAAVSDAWLI